MKFSRAYAKMKVDLNKIFPEDEEIAMAITEHQKINADEELRRRMEDREREAFDIAVIRGAAFRQGKLEGKAEGFAEGMAKIICRLHANDLSIEDIARNTGLEVCEIEKILSLAVK